MVHIPLAQIEFLMKLQLTLISLLQLSSIAKAREALNDDEYADSYETAFNCTTPCDAYEFCGSDLACHSYDNCEIWYELGHPTLTGRHQDASTMARSSSSAGATTIEPLSCVELKDGKDLTYLGQTGICRGETIPLAVSYYEEGNNDTDWQSVCEKPYGKGDAGLPFARQCTARHYDYGFICYDMVGVDLEAKVAEYEDTYDQGLHKVSAPGYWVTILRDYKGQDTDVHFNFPDSMPAYNASTSVDLDKLRNTLVSETFDVHDYDQQEHAFNLCPCHYTEFCGEDGKCYPNNCENLFEQGPEIYTGKSVMGQLNCTEDVIQEEFYDVLPGCNGDFPYAVGYPCTTNWFSHGSFDECMEPVQKFTRMCTAKSEAGSAFVCYDMLSPSTNLSVFADASEDLNKTCSAAESDHEYPGSVTDDEYRFGRHYIHRSKSESSTETVSGRMNYAWSHDTVSSGFDDYLNTERSLHLIYSKVDLKEADSLEVPGVESSGAVTALGFVLFTSAMFM